MTSILTLRSQRPNATSDRAIPRPDGAAVPGDLTNLPASGMPRGDHFEGAVTPPFAGLMAFGGSGAGIAIAPPFSRRGEIGHAEDTEVPSIPPFPCQDRATEGESSTPPAATDESGIPFIPLLGGDDSDERPEGVVRPSEAGGATPEEPTGLPPTPPPVTDGVDLFRTPTAYDMMKDQIEAMIEVNELGDRTSGEHAFDPDEPTAAPDTDGATGIAENGIDPSTGLPPLPAPVDDGPEFILDSQTKPTIMDMLRDDIEDIAEQTQSGGRTGTSEAGYADGPSEDRSLDLDAIRRSLGADPLIRIAPGLVDEGDGATALPRNLASDPETVASERSVGATGPAVDPRIHVVELD